MNQRKDNVKMKNGICTAVGVVGGFVASLFGGWDAALTTLLLFMVIDCHNHLFMFWKVNTSSDKCLI